MNKILALVAVAMSVVASMSAQDAQNCYDNTRHEVGISFGLWSNSQIIDGFEIIGGPTFRGFLELGTGEQGIALVGLRYKF